MNDDQIENDHPAELGNEMLWPDRDRTGHDLNDFATSFVDDFIFE